MEGDFTFLSSTVKKKKNHVNSKFKYFYCSDKNHKILNLLALKYVQIKYEFHYNQLNVIGEN